ncbi:MAG: SWIM zinc finger family protein [Pseudomonadota bacterium]
MNWTADAVLALAPDASSAKAARGLVSPAKWPLLGADTSAVWGECQGSGSKPYQAQVDLNGPAFRCTCPSRKFPCKHGLALMLLRASDPARFGAGPPPAWVSEWLASRTQKAEKKEQKAQATAAPADPQAAAQRAAQRWARMAHAAGELRPWLRDQVARGLGVLGAGQQQDWKTMAARLVDMQVPGLAQRLSEAGELVGSGADWPERVLHALGLLQLACEALERHAALSPAMRAELRVVLGWPFDKAEVLAEGETVCDDWLVIGQATEERDKLTERRVWLQGLRSGRRALVLDHAFVGKGFEQSWLTGHASDASLAYFPGAGALRALVQELHGAPKPVAPPASALEDEWMHVARRAAASPWVPLHPMLVGDAVFGREGEHWQVQAGGQRLPVAVSEEDGWPLLAHGGGKPLQVMGEWNGAALRVLSAWNAEGAWQRGAAA